MTTPVTVQKSFPANTLVWSMAILLSWLLIFVRSRKLPGQPFTRLAPAVLIDQSTKLHPGSPSHLLQHGPRPGFSWEPDAQIGNELHPLGQAQQALHFAVVQNADPA